MTECILQYFSLMKRYVWLTGLFLVLVQATHAQMDLDGSIRYGPEWIRYDRPYFKVRIGSEGIYRLNRSLLASAGFPVETVAGARMTLYHFGKEVPVYVSSAGIWEEDDFLLFHGIPNGSGLDSFLLAGGSADLLHPGYSLVSDTAAYFLSWEDAEVSHYLQVSHDTVGAGPPASWFYGEDIHYFQDVFVKRPSSAGSLSRFSTGEGYTGPAEVSGSLSLKARQKSDIAGVPAYLTLHLVANNTPDHTVEVTVNDRVSLREQFDGFRLLQIQDTLEPAMLREENNLRYTRLGAANNRYSPAYARLSYPRRYDLAGADFIRWTPEAGQGSYFRWSGLDPATTELWLWDPVRRQYQVTWSDQGEAGFYLPGWSGDDPLILFSETAVRSVPALQRIEFQLLDPPAGSYYIVYHPDLRYTQDGMDVLSAYTSYRSTVDGGAYEVYAIDIAAVYDQFGYGVDRHFIALRNMAHYLSGRGTTPSAILLAGKALELHNLRTPARLAEARGQFFIPTFGVPGTDNLLVCGNHQLAPVCPIGRIAVTSAEEWLAYLDKVRRYESAARRPVAEQDRLWMKRVLHLSGGVGTSEQNHLRQVLSGMGAILENGRYGADLLAYSKTSDDPVEGSQTAAIYEQINQGTSLMTYLGHSGSTTLEFDISNLRLHRNPGRWPVFIAMGCSVGNVHRPQRSVSESFVLDREGGSIAFLASSGLGYASVLSIYGRQLYTIMDRSDMASIGTQWLETQRQFGNTQNAFLREHLEQFGIQGDPALRLHYQEGPDLLPDYASLRIDPAFPDPATHSLSVRFDILNAGRREGSSFDVLIERIRPDAHRDSIWLAGVPVPGHRSTYTVRLPTGGLPALGVNRIHITVDHGNRVAEKPQPYAEDNNRLRAPDGSEGFVFLVRDRGVSPVDPPDLAIVTEEKPGLYIHGDAGTPGRAVAWMLDTTPAFSSPALLQHTEALTSSIQRWTPAIQWQPGKVYYWQAMLAGDTIRPGYRSFSYLPGSAPGWRQGHYGQFAPWNTATLGMDPAGNWETAFREVGYDIRIARFQDPAMPSIAVEGQRDPTFLPFQEMSEGLAMIILDPHTGKPWTNPPGGRLGAQNNSQTRVWNSFLYPTRQPASRQALINALQDSIPAGSTVMIYPMLSAAGSSYGVETWLQDSLSPGDIHLIGLFERAGMTEARRLATSGSQPFFMSYVQGGGVLSERYTVSPEDTISVFLKLAERLEQGSYRSPEFPVQGADSVSWYAFAADTARITLMGGRQSAAVDLRTLNNPGSYRLTEEESSQDALLLRLDAVHPATGPADWRIYGEILPDLLWDLSSPAAVPADTLEEGAPLVLQPGIAVFGRIPGLDSIPVRVELISAQNIVWSRDYMAAHDTTAIVTSAPVILTGIPFTGEIRLRFLLDPQNQIRERSKTNNQVERLIRINADKTSPVLSFFVDGHEIMDGDLVSARPEIRIQVLDENKFLRLDDTALFSLAILPPGTQSWYPVDKTDDQVTFLPAAETGPNRAAILYRPLLETDGIYRIRVDIRDRKGNPAAGSVIERSFRVVNKRMISQLLNYPNPFSSSTRFLYTLTGAHPPDHYKICIYTISGHLVREISAAEAGPLSIGTHLTQYTWDGRDEMGQPLANGVYLYRLIIQDSSGERPEHFQTAADRFASGGWSKMVILR